MKIKDIMTVVVGSGNARKEYRGPEATKLINDFIK